MTEDEDEAIEALNEALYEINKDAGRQIIAMFAYFSRHPEPEALAKKLAATLKSMTGDICGHLAEVLEGMSFEDATELLKSQKTPKTFEEHLKEQGN